MGMVLSGQGQLTGLFDEMIGAAVDTDEWLVFTNKQYAPMLEFGTGEFSELDGRQTPWVYPTDDGGFVTTTGMRPRPFFRTGVRKGRARFDSVVRPVWNATADVNTALAHYKADIERQVTLAAHTLVYQRQAEGVPPRPATTPTPTGDLQASITSEKVG